MQDSDTLHVFTSADIFVLTETRMKCDEVFIDGFCCVHAPHHTRVTGKPTADTGGVLVGVKSALSHALLDCKRVDVIDGSAVYMRLDGHKLGLNFILHVVGVYMPHHQSKYYLPNRWDKLDTFLASLPQNECIMLLGDMNGRIGNDVPSIDHGGVPVDIGRVSADCTVNALGQRLLSLCSARALTPLNGLRHTGDTVYEDDRFTDAFTYYANKKGIVSSVIDYVCVSNDLLPYVHSLVLADRKSRSDHFPLTCRLGTVSTEERCEDNVSVSVGKTWFVKGSVFNPVEFGNKLEQSESLTVILDKLESLLNCEPTDVNAHGSLYEYMDDLFDCFMESVRTSLVGVRRKRKGCPTPVRVRRKRHRTYKQAWYDDECKAAAKQMHLSAKCSDAAHKVHVYNQYRDLCRRKREAWLVRRLHEVDRVLCADKANMWSTIDRLLGISEPNAPQVDSDRLRAHYCTAFNADIGAAETIEGPAQPSLPTSPLNLRDNPYFSKEELMYVLKTVKRGKAAGIDGMKSDVLCDLRSVPAFVDAFFILVNAMFHYGFWPREWNKVLIAPLLKHGKDPLDAASYRPIHLICVLAKVVSRIVERKIYTAVGSPEYQLAYMRKHGTRDNLLALHTIIDKYKSRGMYLVFVDFTAAFDSIDRIRLAEKLRAKGTIDDASMRLLSAMLTGVNASVKGAVLKWFNEGLGVKQGDPAGPRVFVTYIHDLPESVCPGDECDRRCAAFLINQIIRCLLWADDLVLFSTEFDHMQKQIGALDVYCDVNHLYVNVPKTKSLFVSTREVPHVVHARSFAYRGTTIGSVDRFRYVGALVDNKGTCDVQAAELLKKATKSMYMCMSKSRRIVFRCPPALRVALFKAHVSSLFSYACEVIPYSRKHIECMNTIVSRYARWATGLPRNACTNAVLREAGLRPVQYDFLQARMNYYLLLMSRSHTHITRLALADLQSRDSTSAFYRWYRGIINAFTKLSCTVLLDGGHSVDTSKRIIKKLVHNLWLSEGGAPFHHFEHQLKFTAYLRSIDSNDVCLGTTYTVRANVLAAPACNIALQTQVVDAYKYGGTGRYHLSTTRVKRCEQEAISLFRTGVAPCFVNMHSEQPSTNRLQRVCPYCKYMHGVLHVHDVFHVLFVCPLVSTERLNMWSSLGSTCGAYEWERVKSVCDLAYALLCPQSVEVASTVGRFLARYLAALQVYKCIRMGSDVSLCSVRWFCGKADDFMNTKFRITSLVESRERGQLEWPTCMHTSTWVSMLCEENVLSAFKVIRNWLQPGWAFNLEPLRKRPIHSIALF